MKFADFVCPGAIVTRLRARERNSVIRELVSVLEKAGKLGGGKADRIATAVINRENEASTGMGKGIAVPHVKHKAIKEVAASIGLSSEGIDFTALDKQPVYSVILLVSPEDEPDRHLQAMECIFKHLQNDKFRKFLRQSQTPRQVQELLQEADDNQNL